MIKWIGCPDSNFQRGRPFGLRPEAVVIHVIDGSFAAGESVFRNPTTQKSAHYGISRSGDVHQYVDENDTAFHAGVVVNPTWALLKPRVNPNFYTIGIEHEGRADDVWPEAQLTASAMLIGQVAARWGIPLDESHVIRHHQIRESKTCPGNWLSMAGLLKRVPIEFAPAGAPIVSAPSVVDGNHATSSLITPKAPTPINPATVAIMVRTVRKANLRLARSTTTVPVVRVIPPHTEFVVSRSEIGEMVNGNPHWYADVQGNYLWAGATDTPDPTLAVVDSAASCAKVRLGQT